MSRNERRRTYHLSGQETSSTPIEEALPIREGDPWQGMQFDCSGKGTKSCGRVVMHINLRTGHVHDQGKWIVIAREEFELRRVLARDRAAFDKKILTAHHIKKILTAHHILHHPGPGDISIR